MYTLKQKVIVRPVTGGSMYIRQRSQSLVLDSLARLAYCHTD